jgi:hypothetical protein
MSIIRYEVHEDFLRIEDGLDSPELRQAIAGLKDVLAGNPSPADLACERRKGNTFRVCIQVNGEPIEVVYEVEGHEIYLAKARRRWLQRFLDNWDDLMKFAP